MTQILSFSLIIWILIDRFKPLWEDCSLKSIITSGIALILGGAVSIVYQLDIVVALGLSDVVSPLGMILTALALMGGSSCVAEIMERVSNPTLNEPVFYDISDIIGSDMDDDEEGDDSDAE